MTMQCPLCSYVRQLEARESDATCPQCGVVYANVQAQSGVPAAMRVADEVAGEVCKTMVASTELDALSLLEFLQFDSHPSGELDGENQSDSAVSGNPAAAAMVSKPILPAPAGCSPVAATAAILPSNVAVVAMRQPTDYLKALRSRTISFRMVQAELRAKGLGAATGWDGLLERYSAPPVVAAERAELVGHFEDIYKRQLFFGRKAVSVYDIDEANVERLAEKLKELTDASSPFSQCYPMPVDEETLRQSSVTPVAVAVEFDDSTLRVVKCCKRFYTAREPIEVDDLDESAKSALSGYDEVFGVKRGVVQGFDSIVLRRSPCRLEVHIDLCCPMAGDELARARNWYADLINSLLKEAAGGEASLGVARNFFPLIETLYNAADGNVISLGHVTGTKSVKEEKMRKRTLDLRVELFHKEGIRAIGHTDAFSITKVWQRDGAIGHPTVTIPGHFSMAGAPHAEIRHVVIDGCATREDFESVLSKLGE